MTAGLRRRYPFHQGTARTLQAPPARFCACHRDRPPWHDWGALGLARGLPTRASFKLKSGCGLPVPVVGPDAALAAGGPPGLPLGSGLG